MKLYSEEEQPQLRMVIMVWKYLEDVALAGVLAFELLRRAKEHRAHIGPGYQEFQVVSLLAESEVTDFEHTPHQDYVLRLDVPVHDFVVVQFFESRCDFPEHAHQLLIREILVVLMPLKLVLLQALLRQFHNKHQLVPKNQEVHVLDDIRMLNLLQDLVVLDLLHQDVPFLPFVHDLRSVCLPWRFVYALIHRGILSFPQEIIV